MSVIADFTIPAESFTLEQALAAEPELTIEAERLASHSVEWVFPFHWATDGDLDAFSDALDRDPTVEEAVIIEEAGDSALFQIQWSDEIVELVTEITNQHASILEAVASDGKWRLQLRFAKEWQVSSFQEHFENQGRAFEVNKLYHPTAPREREYGLTTEQRDTLVEALHRGYFEVPREYSLEQLADVLGVSSNAVSQRIRRGSANLVRHSLTIGTDEPSIEE